MSSLFLTVEDSVLVWTSKLKSLKNKNVFQHLLTIVDIKYLYLNYTVCPRSSDPFYILSYYIKWSLLLGHIVLDFDNERRRSFSYSELGYFSRVEFRSESVFIDSSIRIRFFLEGRIRISIRICNPAVL